MVRLFSSFAVEVFWKRRRGQKGVEEEERRGSHRRGEETVNERHDHRNLSHSRSGLFGPAFCTLIQSSANLNMVASNYFVHSFEIFHLKLNQR